MNGMHNTARKYLAFSGESGLRAALFVYNRKHGIISHLKVPRTKFSLSLLVCKHPDGLIDNSVMLIAFLIPFKKTHSVQKKTEPLRKVNPLFFDASVALSKNKNNRRA